MPDKLNVLLIGSGGREHALAHLLSRSPRLGRLFILPGNAGTAALGTNIPGDPCDVKLALEVARREAIGLTIVGPEDPLAAGMVDAFERAGLQVFGPTAGAARIESDKAFAKQLMRSRAIPTAEARIFEKYETARDYIASRDAALVVKAAGLCKGKGALVCHDPAEAILAAERILRDGLFGAAGRQIIVEEKLEGPEASVMALVDGRNIYVLEAAQDHKRLRDGDQGPNTGGMGAVSRSDLLSDEVLRDVETRVLVPTIDELQRAETPFRGVLFAGLMMTAAGPKVLEFNCRFGDPETQAILMRLRSDLLDVLEAACLGRLDQIDLSWDPRPALCVVMASPGYPGEYPVGLPIHGLQMAPASDDRVVFHAGSALRNGQVVTAGGRVLGVTALGESLSDARKRAYEAVGKITWDGVQFRSDLGLPAV